MSMMVAPYRFAAGGGAGGILGAYTANLWSACGLTRLISGYPNSVNEENVSTGLNADIPFLSNGQIDTAALLAQAPSSGTARLFLDQSGGTRHFQNGTSANQPAIVSGGAYLGQIQFDGSNDGYGSNGVFGGVPACTIFMRAKLRSTAAVAFFAELTGNYNSNEAFTVYYDNAINRLVLGCHGQVAASSRYAISEFNVSVTTESVFCFRFDRTQTSGAAQCVLFVNGTKQTRTGATGETSPVPSGNFQSANIFVGARNAASFFSPLNLKTIVVYSSALSDADCAAISALL